MTYQEWRDANEFGDCSPRAAWDTAYLQGFADAKAELIPEGYVLVPVEPTKAMIDAWWDTHIDGETLDEVKAYKAMTQVAQEEE